MRVTKSLLFFLLVLTACSGEIKQKDKPYNDSIYGKSFADTVIFSGNCTFISTVGDNLLLSNMQPVEGKAYRLVNLISQDLVGTFGNFGAGPGEFLCQEFAGMTADSDTLYAYDITFKQIQVYSKRKDSDLYEYSRTWKVETDDYCYFQKIRRLQNGLYVGIPLSGEKSFFVILNQEGKEICRFGKLPVLGNVEGTIDFKNLEGSLVTVGNSIYFGTRHFGYLARYDVQETGQTNLVWERNLSEPSYEIEESQIRLNRDRNLEGFAGLVVVDDFILATYTGIAAPLKLGSQEHLPKNLLVFNKDGELLRRLHLDVYGTYLTVTEDKKTLIMKCYNPEITYRTYDLDEILADL